MTMVVVFGGGGFFGRRLVDRLTAQGMTVRDQASVAATIAGADAVVNTVSAYVEKGGVTFEVPRLVLVSGIGADADSGSPYIRARDRGEQVVQQTFRKSAYDLEHGYSPSSACVPALPTRPLHLPDLWH